MNINHIYRCNLTSGDVSWNGFDHIPRTGSPRRCRWWTSLQRQSELGAEPHASVSGHRQIAVVRHGPVTIIQFVFEEGGLVREHRAEGVVTIHVLNGRLRWWWTRMRAK